MGRYSRLGHDLYSGRRSFDFVGRKWLWYALSLIIVAIAVGGLLVRGLNLGVEFTGGAQYSVSLPSSQVDQATASELREAVADTGIPGASSPEATTAGTEAVLVQTETLTDAESAEVVETLLATAGVAPDAISQQEVGPSWGAEIAQRALTGIAVFLVLIALLIWAYFREWKMSVAALVALAHDVLITIGLYAIVGFEVSPATVTGVLTILGFSLYDTVVVFDKVRENTIGLNQANRSYAESANLAVNQTVVRSINTSVVALLPVGAILYVGAVQLGSGSMKDLALALFVGLAAGTYSSIFIATPLAVHLKSNETDVVLAERRAKARRRAEADPYATVPSFADDMPVAEEPGAEPTASATPDRDRPVPPARPAGVAQHSVVPEPERRPDAAGRGRTAPAPRGPVKPSGASGRQQPQRRSRAKRDR